MDVPETPSKVDLLHADDKVIFTISDCSLNRKYSFYGLSREDAERFMKRIKHIEKMTWRQLSASSRQSGLTSEFDGTDSFRMIDEQNTSDGKLVGERYYFHFRVEQEGLFRVFGYQKGQFFCITHIDAEGRIHH